MEKLKDALKKLSPKLQKISLIFSQWLGKVNLEKPLRFLLKKGGFIAAFLIALALADLTVLFVWPFFLPSAEGPSYRRPIQRPAQTKRAPENWLLSKNIFHRGPIPEAGGSLTSSAGAAGEASRLPFKLLGTIEGSKPEYSMASIYLNSKQESHSYFIGDIIDDKAQIKSIERRKVIFLNFGNNQIEFIEIPLDEGGGGFALSSPSKKEAPALLSPVLKDRPAFEGVVETKPNQYSVNRSTINRYMQKLPDILQQARVDPKLGPDGTVLGHTFRWIKKNSLFEGLGFSKGDTIISVNGEKASGQNEAAELFQRFRSQSDFDVVVEGQDGKIRKLTYRVDEDASVN